ncbi:MAG: hypothetical protein ACI9BW_002566, partial [Gammaproteobacteria bacterium]
MIAFGFVSTHADTIDEHPDSPLGCQQLHVTPLDSELGSVGFMKNIAEHPESIRSVAKRLLTKAVAASELEKQPECQTACRGVLTSEVVYRVEPTVFLAESEQQAMCLTLEDQTKLEPFRRTA